ncbi:MAG: hypothetical protein IV100_03670 [Myxococcales bacterium]|nr:hypothetical protein [Myxococcales bacterium]
MLVSCNKIFACLLSVVGLSASSVHAEVPQLTQELMAIVIATPESRKPDPKHAAVVSQFAGLLEAALTRAGTGRARFMVPARLTELSEARTALEAARRALATDAGFAQRDAHEARYGDVLLLLKSAAASAPAALFSEVYRVLGLTRILSGDSRLALEYMRSAYTLSPFTDQELFGMQPLKPLLSEVAAERTTGKILIVTEPPLAEVIVGDGGVQGLSPLELELPVGTHLVRVRRDGSEAQGLLVDVRAGVTERRLVKLPPLPGAANAELLARQLTDPKKPLLGPAQPEALATLDRLYGSRNVVVIRVGIAPAKKKSPKRFILSGVQRRPDGTIVGIAVEIPLDAGVLSAIESLVTGWMAPSPALKPALEPAAVPTGEGAPAP